MFTETIKEMLEIAGNGVQAAMDAAMGCTDQASWYENFLREA